MSKKDIPKEVFPFTAKILQHDTQDAAFVEVPLDIENLFGTRAQVKIKAVFEGIVHYRGSLVPKGGRHVLGMTKAIRKELNKTFGEEVAVVITRDTEERTVLVPPDVQELFGQHPNIEVLFSAMSYTHRKEYIRWIEDAKKPETREKRKLKMLEMIAAGRKGV